MAPSSQLDFPSERMKFAIRIDAKVAVVSIGPKFNDSPTPNIHAKITMSGAISKAICTLLPIAIPRERSILFFPATITAVKCSAAFPKMEGG